VLGDVLVDGLADVLRQRDVPELAGFAELQRSQLGARVDMLLHAQGLALVDTAAEVDGERFADPQPAAVHEPHGGGPVGGQPGGQCLHLRVGGQDEVLLRDDAGQGDAGAG
jgi:hypothetical protein